METTLDLTLTHMSGEELAVVCAETSWTVAELKAFASRSLDLSSRITDLLLETCRLPESQTLKQLGLETGTELLAVIGKRYEMDVEGKPILGFLEEEHRTFLTAAVAEEVGAHAQDLSCWSVAAVASSADDQPALPRDFEKLAEGASLTSSNCAHLFIFRTVQGYIAGAFRIGFSDADEHAFVFSLVRPAGSGARGIPFLPGLTPLSHEPVKLKVRPDCAGRAIYTGGGATVCFGSGNTGSEDFDFNSLVPFVASNLSCYGPHGTDPVLLFGGGETVTNGDRFEYKPDIMLAYQIPLAQEAAASS